MKNAAETAHIDCPVCGCRVHHNLIFGHLRLVLKWMPKEQRPLTLLDPERGNSSVYELPDCDRVRRQFLLKADGKGFKGLIEGILIWIPKRKRRVS